MNEIQKKEFRRRLGRALRKHSGLPRKQQESLKDYLNRCYQVSGVERSIGQAASDIYTDLISKDFGGVDYIE